MLLFITKASLHSYADKKNISASSTDAASLMEFLSQESNTAIDWLLSNHIIVNPKKFQTIVTTQRNLQNNPASLSINNKNSVELLGVNIDNKLAFETHINKFCRSASCQLNAIIRLESFLRFQAKKILIESFVYSNFTKRSILDVAAVLDPLLDTSAKQSYYKKSKILKNELYNTCMMILRVATVTYFKNQIKLLWELKTLVVMYRNLKSTRSAKPRIYV